MLSKTNITTNNVTIGNRPCVVITASSVSMTCITPPSADTTTTTAALAAGLAVADPVWVNGQQVVSKIRSGPIDGGKASAAALKLHQGWNHVLIKVIQGSGGWQFTGRLTCSQPDFLGDLESSFEKP